MQCRKVFCWLSASVTFYVDQHQTKHTNTNKHKLKIVTSAQQKSAVKRSRQGMPVAFPHIYQSFTFMRDSFEQWKSVMLGNWVMSRQPEAKKGHQDCLTLTYPQIQTAKSSSYQHRQKNSCICGADVKKPENECKKDIKQGRRQPRRSRARATRNVIKAEERESRAIKHVRKQKLRHKIQLLRLLHVVSLMQQTMRLGRTGCVGKWDVL